MKRILALVAIAATLSACTPDKLVADPTAKLTVTARKSTNKRYWVTLSDGKGATFEQVRVGGKRCRRGRSTLKVGTVIDARIQTWEREDKSRYRTVDKSSFRSKFC